MNLQYGWDLRKIDFNSAFLYDILEEEVFMEKPEGFVDPKYLDNIYKLNKALYGLKQASRVWFERLNGALIKFGFVQSKVNPSLFIYNSTGG